MIIAIITNPLSYIRSRLIAIDSAADMSEPMILIIFYTEIIGVYLGYSWLIC